MLKSFHLTPYLPIFEIHQPMVNQPLVSGALGGEAPVATDIGWGDSAAPGIVGQALLPQQTPRRVIGLPGGALAKAAAACAPTSMTQFLRGAQ